LNDEEIIVMLEESLQYNLGDWGRTQYIIERIQKKMEIFQSDKKYIDRMLDGIQKIHQTLLEIEKTEKVKQKIFVQDLIKCDRCELEIGLNQKAIRRKNFWFHEKCFDTIEYKKNIPTLHIIENLPPRKPTTYYESKSNIITNTTKSTQIIFTFSLVMSLIVTIYFLLGTVFAIMTSIIGIGNSIILYNADILKFFNKKKIHGENSESFLIKTGIPGLDSIISGGLKQDRSVIISGPPGSGKTTFGLQFLYSGAKDFDEPGVYITMSQNIDEIKNDCKSFGWDFDELINQDKIMMIDARPFKIQDEMIGKDDSLYRGEQMPFEHLTKLLLSSIKRVDAKRVVIDSITILAMQYSDKFYMRQGLQAMIQALENYGVTSLLISEYSENNEIPLEWFVTSGIIQMNNQIIENIPRQTIQIKKLRGIKHSQQIHPIVLDGDGLHILEQS